MTQYHQRACALLARVKTQHHSFKTLTPPLSGGGAQTHTSGAVRDWGSSKREAAIPRTLPLETCVFRCLWQSGDIYGPVSKKLSKVYNKMYKITKDTIVLESSYQNHFKMCTFIKVYFSEGKLSYKIYISLICIICYINVLEYPPMKYP